MLSALSSVKLSAKALVFLSNRKREPCAAVFRMIQWQNCPRNISYLQSVGLGTLGTVLLCVCEWEWKLPKREQRKGTLRGEMR